MRIWLTAAILTALPTTASLAAADPLASETQALAAEITAHGRAYDDLVELTQIGPRLAASPNAARAVAWAKAKLEAYGFDHVTLQPMTTPYWTRGAVERALLTDAAQSVELKVTALGGSIGTAAGGVEAEVVEVQSLAEVARLGEAVRGKIVFYNRPMDPLIDPFEAYGGAIDQRTSGASQAARYGAVAALVRTLTPQLDDDHPHTGNVSYRGDAAKIPAAAVSTHGANELAERLRANPRLRLRIELSAESHGTASSFNVYGDLIGSEHPEEIVLVGGHLDSWDLGVGAQDDGAGVVQSIEVVRAMKALGMHPKRTVRVVLFMAEEEGGYGGRDYAAAVAHDGTRHVAALESDRGGFAPVGFETDAGGATVTKLRGWAAYLAPLGTTTVASSGSGTDIEPLLSLGAETVGFVPDATHYFDYHHASTDQMTAVNKTELHAGAAAMAALVWLYAQEER